MDSAGDDLEAVGSPMSSSTPTSSNRRGRKRPSVTSSASLQPVQAEPINTGPLPVKQAKGDSSTLEKLQKECRNASLGFARIAISNLGKSDLQVRPLQMWKVDKLEESMAKHSDSAYQPYCVLTTNSLPQRNLWSVNTANGYKYDIIGGQHSVEACRRMVAKDASNETFKARFCQVYYSPALSFDAKKYLGMVHNRVGETRWADSTKEKLMTCRAIYQNHKDDCPQQKKIAEWRSKCSVMLAEPLHNKNLKVLMTIAQMGDLLYKKILDVVTKYEEGALLGQKHGGSFHSMPVYQFRTLTVLSDANIMLVLDLVLRKELNVNRISAEIKRAQAVQHAQRLLCLHFGVNNLDTLQGMFPRHMSREVLSNQFGNLPIPKDKDSVPEAIKQWARELELLYADGTDAIRTCTTTIQGDGCIGFIHHLDATELQMDKLKNGNKSLPMVKLTIIDLPEEWTMIQLQGTLAFLTAFHVEANNNQPVTAILCPVSQVVDVMKTIKNLGQFECIKDVYYHIKNMQQGGILPMSIHSVVLAFKTTPESFKWVDGMKANFLGTVEGNKKYKDEEGKVVDSYQKPIELYNKIIESITSKEQWVMDLCCGTGTGLIAALNGKRNYIGVDKDEITIQHLRGRYNIEKADPPQEAPIEAPQGSEIGNANDSEGSDSNAED